MICPVWGCHAFASRINLAVAANFYDTAVTLQKLYEQEYPHILQLITGSTGRLRHQIAQGAPYHVFFAADDEPLPGCQCFTYAIGRLVILAEKPEAFERIKLNIGHDDRMIAMAKPELAPYGRAAAQVLQSFGYRLSRQRLLLANNVSQVLQFSRQSANIYSFLSLAQVQARNIERELYAIVPASLHSPIRQNLCVSEQGSRLKAVYSFIHFIRGGQSIDLIRKSGYEVPKHD